ncbi:hypothetical protein EW145_g2915 [Phellinidium pouzarii]|uniref:Uncharacterized protein n=1 Tax=Phellinidium pouzarii TaxID=167371 RepID=A0A4V3XD25_9AGAM|nr:hypothetical protein EW145_g2915 [Phellinidium pouzarii]
MSSRSYLPHSGKYDGRTPTELPAFSEESRNARLQRELPSSSINENPHSRVQSLHGVIGHALHIRPGQDGEILEEPEPESESQILTTEELMSGLNREEDIGTQREVLNSADWYEERSPRSSPTQEQYPQPRFTPRQSSPRAESPSSEFSQYQQNGYSQPRYGALGQPGTLSPPPRSSGASGSEQQRFPDRQRFQLVDGGAISDPASPIFARRAVSESDTTPNSRDSSLRGHSGGLTPPLRRSPRGESPAGSQPGTPKYATFEEMGIRGRGIAEAQAEKEGKDCIVM